MNELNNVEESTPRPVELKIDPATKISLSKLDKLSAGIFDVVFTEHKQLFAVCDYIEKIYTESIDQDNDSPDLTSIRFDMGDQIGKQRLKSIIDGIADVCDNFAVTLYPHTINYLKYKDVMKSISMANEWMLKHGIPYLFEHEHGINQIRYRIVRHGVLYGPIDSDMKSVIAFLDKWLHKAAHGMNKIESIITYEEMSDLSYAIADDIKYDHFSQDNFSQYVYVLNCKLSMMHVPFKLEALESKNFQGAYVFWYPRPLTTSEYVNLVERGWMNK